MRFYTSQRNCVTLFYLTDKEIKSHSINHIQLRSVFPREYLDYMVLPRHPLSLLETIPTDLKHTLPEISLIDKNGLLL